MLCTVLPMAAAKKNKSAGQDLFPNGEPIPAWFNDTTRVDVATLGKQYIITDYGVEQDSIIAQTDAIQAVIDKAANEGGGVIVIPRGTFLSGSLFFKQGTHLWLQEGARLKGSARIGNFELLETRMEGQTLNYFAALVNADGIKGFTITGPGTIDGNGYYYWDEFWLRRQYNSQCTNLEAMRPRLVYISNCEDVTVQDVKLINSPFWTNHLYRSSRVKYLGCYIYAPTSGYGLNFDKGAPSSDAIDIDYCHDVLVSNCYMSVNDDAVVLKGGKGTYADKDPRNGPNYNIVVQDCNYGKVHGCITFGSESLHDWNIVLRRINIKDVNRVIWFKMRPDTPQHYEQLLVEDVKGSAGNFLVTLPWTQFYKPEERADMPLSRVNNITFRNIIVFCKAFFNVKASDKYKLSDFTFENCKITETAESTDWKLDFIENLNMENFSVVK
ncbi:MAG: exopolygalacturonase [Bacteroidaceae bacterium]|nr:exopolygalacturonase [Bacteroidaceae bacterium]